MALSAARRATYIAVPLALIAGALTALLIANSLSSITGDGAANTSTITNVKVALDPSTDQLCSAFANAVPATIDGRKQRPVKGYPAGAGWGQPPILAVCGVTKPANLTPGSNLTSVNGVTWFVQEDTDTAAYGVSGKNTLWITVDRVANVAVAVPNGIEGSVAIAPISTSIAASLKSIES